MNYFFVFQNKSYEEEYRGEYLWAPQYNQLGATPSHWKRMKDIRSGDIIIHSYKKMIKAISIAKSDVYEAIRPTELSSEWGQEGWRVDAEYIPFTKTIITSDYAIELSKLKPQDHAPFNKDNRGNTGYLYKANEAMYTFIIQKIASIQKDKHDEKAILSLLDLTSGDASPVEQLETEMHLERKNAEKLTPEKLAMQVASSKPKKAQKSESVVYYRSPYIKEMVKQLAEGRCQMCGQEAPFYDGEKPYLEEHHVTKLADGGSDTMDNVVAVCPNCHRQIHVLNLDVDNMKLKKIAAQNFEDFNRLLAYSQQLASKR